MQIITLGIGTPGTIGGFILMGLTAGVAPTAVIQLTLSTRTPAVTLETRSRSTTLATRSTALTLDSRD